MTREEFFDLFCRELTQNSALFPYYKLTNGSLRQRLFRKAYYMQRLEFVDKHINRTGQPQIWDCGCGYGSTCFYLSLNGLTCTGSTLEYYAQEIENRRKYWRQFGNIDNFSYLYENIFDNPPSPESYDYIILQDTLHHIEPISQGLEILSRALKPNGKLIITEPNGSSLIESLIYFLRRGNNRIVEYYDEKLQKTILFGNENIRSLGTWTKLFTEAGLVIDPLTVEYIRFFLPFCYGTDEQKIIQLEQKIADKFFIVKQYGFFGLNMVVERKE